MAVVGSDPIDKRQIVGVLGSVSSHNFSTSRITPSAYRSPNVSAMYLRAYGRRGNSELGTGIKLKILSAYICISLAKCLNDVSTGLEGAKRNDTQKSILLRYFSND